MNSWQKCILGVAAVLVTVTLICPPFHIVGSGGARRGFGYGWIFEAPIDLATVDVGLLLTQWLGFGIIAAIAYVLAGPVRKEGHSVRSGGAVPSVPTLHDRISMPAAPVGPSPSATRHFLRWVVLVACFVLATALWGVSSAILKELGLGGAVGGAIGGALYFWFLFWVWGATRRIVSPNPNPSRAVNTDARQARGARPPNSN